MSNNLSQTTHWRNMRNMVFMPLATYENIDLSEYDFYHVRCYDVLGAEIQGSNVTCYTANGYSPFVYNDTYDVYEVPKKSNSTSYNGVEGVFLLYAHDTTNDYWTMADFEYRINKQKTLDSTFLTSTVEIAPWRLLQYIR